MLGGGEGGLGVGRKMTHMIEIRRRFPRLNYPFKEVESGGENRHDERSTKCV